ncbi:MAG: hypothetical protein NTW06_02060 [Candidatus Falkowbacteria bacterium]|nr:hypothetical protein [Candidatus Falkowbacteria bacterium]
MGNHYWVIVFCAILLVLVTIFCLRKKKNKNEGKIQQKEEWDPEKKFDTEVGFSGINLTDSIALAVEFYFRAIFGALDEKKRSLIHINPIWVNKKCEYIAPNPIHHEVSGDSRIIFIGTRENHDVAYRVVVCRRPGQKWRVVGFHYPRDGKGHYYAVFEAHHYWFQWWESPDSSGYLSPQVNPDY